MVFVKKSFLFTKFPFSSLLGIKNFASSKLIEEGIVLIPSTKNNKFEVFERKSSTTSIAEASSSSEDKYAGHSYYEENKEKPIVLLYGWLMSKERHLKKFSDFYNGHGFDVLRVNVDVREVLWPKLVNKKIEGIKKFMFSNLNRPYLVHGFSVGGFVHMELLHQLLHPSNTNEHSGHVAKQIKAQIFDSVVDIAGIAEGISTALYLSHPIKRNFVRILLKSYLTLTSSYVMPIYERDSKMFYTNILDLPSLMFYSKVDPIGRREPIEKAMNFWKTKGLHVESRCWEDTPHVGHFKKDPNVYFEMISSFLTSLNLIPSNPSPTIQPFGDTIDASTSKDFGPTTTLRNHRYHEKNREGTGFVVSPLQSNVN